MGNNKKSEPSMSNPFAWVFRASLLLLGAAIALNLAVAWLRPVLPWLVGSVGLIVTAWIATAIVRWRRSSY